MSAMRLMAIMRVTSALLLCASLRAVLEQRVSRILSALFLRQCLAIVWRISCRIPNTPIKYEKNASYVNFDNIELSCIRLTAPR